jgi:hypothetical protein
MTPTTKTTFNLAKGTTMRLVSIKELADFELAVPGLEVQQHAAGVVAVVERMSRLATAIAAGVEQLITAELRLTYADVAP